MVMTEGQTGEPRWVADTLAKWWSDVKLFAATAARLALRPRAFGATWSTGQMRAMNPLGFMAASWPLLLPLDYGLQQLLGWSHRTNVPLIVEVARALRPFLSAIPIAMLLHVLFLFTGSRRRFTTTLGASMYWMALATAGWVVGLVGCLVSGAGHWLPNLTGYLTMIWGALVLAGVHRLHWFWCLVGLAISAPAALIGVNVLLNRLGLA